MSAIDAKGNGEGAATTRPGSAPGTASSTSDSAQDSQVQAAEQTAEDTANHTAAGKAADKKADKDNDSKPSGETFSTLMQAHVETAKQEISRAATTAGKTTMSTPPASSDPISPDRHVLPSSTMKDISVRVEAEQGGTVDIRIVQRAGNLQIAVKSADSDTTQGLRHGLSDLANRLNETDYHAETWHPGHTAAAPESSAESSNSSHQQSSDNSQSNSGGSQHNRGQRDNNPSNRPRWVQELESNLGGGAESTGHFHGFIS